MGWNAVLRSRKEGMGSPSMSSVLTAPCITAAHIYFSEFKVAGGGVGGWAAVRVHPLSEGERTETRCVQGGKAHFIDLMFIDKTPKGKFQNVGLAGGESIT